MDKESSRTQFLPKNSNPQHFPRPSLSDAPPGFPFLHTFRSDVSELRLCFRHFFKEGRRGESVSLAGHLIPKGARGSLGRSQRRGGRTALRRGVRGKWSIPQENSTEAAREKGLPDAERVSLWKSLEKYLPPKMHSKQYTKS